MDDFVPQDGSRKLEWLETDGQGGFACGTAAGVRTRRYHALLLAAAKPPAGRFVLINGFDAWVTTRTGTYSISAQRYPQGDLQPDGFKRLKRFTYRPWPRWNFVLDDGTEIGQEIFIAKSSGITVVSWRLTKPQENVTLSLRPFFSGRDYHALHRENKAFCFDPQSSGRMLVWRPYEGVPATAALFNGVYSHAPVWYRQFLYEEERSRGLDCVEDLASPGVFRWDISNNPAVWLLAAVKDGVNALEPNDNPVELAKTLRDKETRRRQYGSTLKASADAYLVRRGEGRSIIAGYPWFTDWGRDTFIAMRGLCLATGRFKEAIDILREWTKTISQGMVPNRFPDDGGAPEYNSADAALWMVIAIHEVLELAAQGRFQMEADHRRILEQAIESVVSGYFAGTRWGIRVDSDGLLFAGEPGTALTWMDAKVDGVAVTPRAGKPVELEALWINALRAVGLRSKSWTGAWQKAQESFNRRFWNEDKGCLYDVVDVDQKPGVMNSLIRPNQIFAVGGLPWPVLEGEKAKRVVDAVEQKLWTPLGLRSLAPEESGFCPHYEGNVMQRDWAYHQGTAWPWLIGAFAQAWVRVRQGSRESKQEARKKFLEPLIGHMEEAGLGHISEIADAQPPQTLRGCPFQAWSVGEALRLDLDVLALNQNSSRHRDESEAKF